MNKRILFVLNDYYPKPYANGNCAQNLIDLYLKDSVSVDVLCVRHPLYKYPSTWNGVELHTVKPNLRLAMFLNAADTKSYFKKKLYLLFGRVLSLATRIFLFPFLPLMTISLHKRYEKEILKLYKANKYDGVVTIINPLEAGLAMVNLRKKKKIDAKWAVFCVDNVLENSEKDKSKVRGSYLYENFLKYADRYICIKTRLSDYQRPYLDGLRGNLVVGDLPLIKKPEHADKIQDDEFDSEHEHWCYYGSIGGKHYPYNEFLNFFYSLPNDKKRKLHIFTRSFQLEGVNSNRDNEFKKIVIHDYVGKKTMGSYFNMTDVFVSIKYTSNISAKFFEYISTGGKIVHFSGTKYDQDAIYLEKYPNAIVLKVYEKDINQLVEQYMNFKKTKIEFNQIIDTFVENTPEYNKKIIDECLFKENK